MAEAAPRPATYADLEAVPEHLVAEIIDGVLETHGPLPPRHCAAAASLAGALSGPVTRPRSAPDSWILAIRPELHLGPQVVVPDFAGWRRARLSVESETAYVETPPDWVCEILSPSTARVDRGPKRRIYAETGVGYLWLLDPGEGVLEGFTLTGRRWLLAGTVLRGESVALPPFEAHPFAFDDLFPFDDPAAPPAP